MAERGTTPKYSAKACLKAKIKMIFCGDTLEEYEEDIRAGCFFAEKCKFNQVRMMKESASFEAMHKLAQELNRIFKVVLFNTPETETYKKIYDHETHAFREGYVEARESVSTASEAKITGPSSVKAAEGTVHLDSSMTATEITRAICKGGMKTIDIDDFESFKDKLKEVKAK